MASTYNSRLLVPEVLLLWRAVKKQGWVVALVPFWEIDYAWQLAQTHND